MWPTKINPFKAATCDGNSSRDRFKRVSDAVKAIPEIIESYANGQYPTQ